MEKHTLSNHELMTIDGHPIKLDAYQGKVLVIINTASKCGFTPQYADLEKLYETYKARGFEVLGFPCNQFADQEPGTTDQVKSFCELNYGVSFPLFDKVHVKGPEAHPLFRELVAAKPFEGFDLSHPGGKMLHAFLSDSAPASLTDDSIKWNFTKFLVDRDGQVVKRFESPVDPYDMTSEIEALL